MPEVVYDADGRVTKVIDEEGGETSYTYDKDNRLISMTDAEGLCRLLRVRRQRQLRQNDHRRRRQPL